MPRAGAAHQKVLDSAVHRWSSLPWQQLEARLRDVRSYQVQMESGTYQVEVELLENTPKYLHVIVAVDDGSLPRSTAPLTRSFVVHKTPPL
ncbi:MAG TPA: hypothetical protein VME43_22090 [Bryobacteraceae bacterium]|nr:hypothetical protein [Bryobacteraceae bacterium]